MGDIIQMDDEFTCTAAEETALVKIFIFNLSPIMKYRVENVLLGRKNSVYSQFSAVQIGFAKNPFEYRSLSMGYLTPIGSTAYASVPGASFNDNSPKPIPEGAIQLFVAFWQPKNGDKCTVNLSVRTL